MSHDENHATYKKQGKNDYTPEFEKFWGIYPKRDGGNSKYDAFKKWKARLKEKDDIEVIYKGAGDYAAYCERTGLINTSAIMAAKTFLGPAKHYLEKWEEKGYGTNKFDRQSEADKLHDAANRLRQKYCQNGTVINEADGDISDF